MAGGPFLSFCGAPPDPASLIGRWTPHLSLWAALAAGLAAYLWLSRREVGRGRRAAFFAGWAVAALALVSPLCALSVSLFSARVGQHMLLALLAAPLMALGLPDPAGRWRRCEMPSALAFAAALWVWHAPGPYAATFRSDVVYWLMDLTILASSTALWWAVLRAPAGRMGVAVAATVAAGLQMALLGAVITWASRPLYAPHLLTTADWGLTPLQDQQLGGALMWAPGGLIFMAAIVAPLAVLLAAPSRPPTPALT